MAEGGPRPFSEVERGSGTRHVVLLAGGSAIAREGPCISLPLRHGLALVCRSGVVRACKSAMWLVDEAAPKPPLPDPCAVCFELSQQAQAQHRLACQAPGCSVSDAARLWINLSVRRSCSCGLVSLAERSLLQ